MVRICVVGNSHIGALKAGWGALAPDHPHLALTFFGAPGKSMRDITVSDGALVPTAPRVRDMMLHTSGGKDRIAGGDYDVFLVYGLDTLVQPYADYFSAALIEATARDIFVKSSSGQLCRLLREMTATRLFVGSRPLPPQSDTASPAGHAYETVAHLAQRALSKENVALVTQPKETMAGEWSTDSAFAKAGVGIATPEREARMLAKGREAPSHDDHMNGMFGEQFLRAFFQQADVRVMSVSS